MYVYTDKKHPVSRLIYNNVLNVSISTIKPHIKIIINKLIVTYICRILKVKLYSVDNKL